MKKTTGDKPTTEQTPAVVETAETKKASNEANINDEDAIFVVKKTKKYCSIDNKKHCLVYNGKQLENDKTMTGEIQYITLRWDEGDPAKDIYSGEEIEFSMKGANNIYFIFSFYTRVISGLKILCYLPNVTSKNIGIAVAKDEGKTPNGGKNPPKVFVGVQIDDDVKFLKMALSFRQDENGTEFLFYKEDVDRKPVDTAEILSSFAHSIGVPFFNELHHE